MNKFLLLLFKFKKVTPQKETGFTTLEILISLIIALLFVAVSMQSLVYAMAMKVQAQEKQRANELIQEDIERINRLGSTALTATCNATASGYVDGYAKALWDALQAVAPGDDSTTSDSLKKTIIKKIKADGSLDTGATGGRQLALRRLYNTTGSNSTTPHRTLKVGYQVWYGYGGTPATFKNKNGGTIATNDEPIAETYVEIIPDVALQCP
jgi:type II secretory pathway pseudopilin PulG